MVGSGPKGWGGMVLAAGGGLRDGGGDGAARRHPRGPRGTQSFTARCSQQQTALFGGFGLSASVGATMLLVGLPAGRRRAV